MGFCYGSCFHDEHVGSREAAMMGRACHHLRAPAINFAARERSGECPVRSGGFGIGAADTAGQSAALGTESILMLLNMETCLCARAKQMQESQ